MNYMWRHPEDHVEDDWDLIQAFDKEHAARKLGEFYHRQDPESLEFEFIVANEDLSCQRHFIVTGEYDIHFSASVKGN